MEGGQWTEGSRSKYNLRDAVSRYTTQVRKQHRASNTTHVNLLKGWPCPFFLFNYGGLNTGISEILDCNIYCPGQCGNVEHKIRGLGKAIFGSAILSTGLHTIEIMERRAPDS